MNVKKKPGTRWKYSRQLAWTLKHTTLPKINVPIDEIIWTVSPYVAGMDSVRKFVAEYFSAGILVARIEGKVIYLGDEMRLLISEEIVY